ncbi:uncharacterized protein LOC105690080 [Athalia rosae]|uniref:uncharacterized protein LOC105690080 n=1 Tax=Athalia rosae TaxID=37344 RepID=UPI00203382DB|nr:uncharacterized protein LOC105690080 [Athalia rosae]
MKLLVPFILTITLTSLADCYSDTDDGNLGSPRVSHLSTAQSRFRRSPDPEPQGSFGATFGGQQFPGQNWQHNVGAHASYRFQRPQGSLTASWQKSFSGPERRPSYNIGYQQTLFQNRHGSVSATAGAQKLPGQRWQPNVGIGASFRFRRSPRSDLES